MSRVYACKGVIHGNRLAEILIFSTPPVHLVFVMRPLSKLRPFLPVRLQAHPTGKLLFHMTL